MKRHIFLFNQGSRATVYGIGTYIRQMVSCLISMSDVSLHLVQLKSDVEQVTLSLLDGYDELSIPRNLFLPNDKSERYYLNTWRLVQVYFPIAESELVIFLLNYSSHHVLIPQMRAAFPSCQIYFTIHYQEWCFSLNGSISRFREILRTQDIDTLDSVGKEVYESYRKEKKTYEQVDKVICLSRFTELVLWNEYQIVQNKTIVIYNGLQDEADPCLPDMKGSLKKQLGFQPEEKIVLFVGRLDPIKGVQILIHSFLSVLEKRQDCHLILVGDGDISRYLKECDGYWNKITFTGRLEKERLYQFYQIADVGVLPSMHEQCSYTGIEMMMFGIPLVASTFVGLKEMISENKNGILFDVQNKNDLTNLLELVLSTISDSSTKKFDPRLDYLERYTIQRMREQYENLIKSFEC